MIPECGWQYDVEHIFIINATIGQEDVRGPGQCTLCVSAHAHLLTGSPSTVMRVGANNLTRLDKLILFFGSYSATLWGGVKNK